METPRKLSERTDEIKAAIDLEGEFRLEFGYSRHNIDNLMESLGTGYRVEVRMPLASYFRVWLITGPTARTQKFLAEYEKACNSGLRKPEVDQALLALLTEYASYLPEWDDMNRFHKAFRQTDVTPSGKIDVAIHRLISASSLFWDVVEELGYNEKGREAE